MLTPARNNSLTNQLHFPLDQNPHLTNPAQSPSKSLEKESQMLDLNSGIQEM